MTTKWTANKTIKFLEEYKGQRSLWCAQSPLYKNKDARENAYSNIARAMNLSDADVKAKIRSLRTSYATELRQIKKSIINEDEEIYVPRVPWFPVAHQFLEDVIQTKDEDRDRNVEFIETTTEDYSLSDIGSSTTTHRTRKAQKRFKGNSTPKEEEAEEEAEEPEEPELMHEELVEEVVEDLNMSSPVIKIKKFEEKEDEFEVYGKNVACQLRRLPEEMSISSMLCIQKHLASQRLEAAHKKPKKRTSYILS